MEIRQLRYFIAVADTLNFSRAASSVYLSQSALSRQIMDLEKEVGLPLFRRSTRQVELTDAGKALQKSAKELISRWEKMLPEVRNAVSDEARALTLTIGVDARKTYEHKVATHLHSRDAVHACQHMREDMCNTPRMTL